MSIDEKRVRKEREPEIRRASGTKRMDEKRRRNQEGGGGGKRNQAKEAPP